MQDLESLECGHTFHSTCLCKWLSSNGLNRENGCPMNCSKSADFQNDSNDVGPNSQETMQLGDGGESTDGECCDKALPL